MDPTLLRRYEELPSAELRMIVGPSRNDYTAEAVAVAEYVLAERTDDTATFPSSEESVSASAPENPGPAARPQSASAALVSNSRSKSYMRKHWDGELSLPVSYWVNSLLLASLSPLIVLAAVAALAEAKLSLRAIAAVGVAQTVTPIALWLWGIVGVWRSADNHAARGGTPVWASLAKVAVVLGALATTYHLTTSVGPQVKEFALIALGRDPLGSFQVMVSSDGRSVLVSGVLREGSAKAIQNILEAAPGATTLVLSSNGGRLAEAKALAEFVRAKQLDTYVEQACVSACTFVFLAGRDRAATPNAKIGFHAPSFPGDDPLTIEAGRQFAMAVYRAAGLPEAFIARALPSDSKEMWYPTRDELIEVRVLTRLSFGGETAIGFAHIRSKPDLLLLMRQIPLYAALEARFPDVVASAVDQAWSVHQKGGSDAEVRNAMRQVIGNVYSRLLVQSNDSARLSYVQLFLDQIKAVRAIGYEACGLYLDGKLDITAVLPKPYQEREAAWLLAAVSSPPESMPKRNRLTLERAVAQVLSKLPPAYADVAAEPTRYAARPNLRCDSAIALYEAAVSFPSETRAAALEGLLTVE